MVIETQTPKTNVYDSYFASNIGERTFGVLTKLDLMDKGTNALDVSFWLFGSSSCLHFGACSRMNPFSTTCTTLWSQGSRRKIISSSTSLGGNRE